MADESLLSFPCDFPLKVMGNNTDVFRTTVIGIVSNLVSQTPVTKERPSKDNNFMAFTLLIHVDSQEQLDGIYRELSSNEHVLMVL